MRDLYRALYSALFVCGNLKNTLGYLQARIIRSNQLVFGQKRVSDFTSLVHDE